MIDTNAAFRSWLLQSDAIQAMTEGRVYCPDLPEGIDPSNGVAITFQRRGGNADLYLPIVSPSITVKCWAGRDQAVQANQLYRAVFDQVHGQNNVNLADLGYVLSCFEQVQGQDVTDPDTGWATVVTFFQLTMRSV
jgi:hypothetical protein